MAPNVHSTPTSDLVDDVFERAYAWLDDRPTSALALVEPFRHGSEPEGRGRAIVLALRVALRGGDLDRALQLLVGAQIIVGEIDAPSLQVELAVAQARLALYSGSYDDALAQAELAIVVADANGLDRLRLESRSTRNLVAAFLHDADTEQGTLELVELAASLGRPFEEALGRKDHAFWLATQGRHHEALAAVDVACSMARALPSRQREALAYALGTRADVLLALGDSVSGLADADAVLAFLEEGDDADLYLLSGILDVRMRCLAALGRNEDVVHTAHAGLRALGDTLPSMRAGLLRSLAAALRRTGRDGEAYAALEAGFELEREGLQQQARGQLALQRAMLETNAARTRAESMATKNAELESLLAELNQAHGELRSRMEELEDLRDRLREQADRDWLTGLRNRRWLARELGPLLDRDARLSGTSSVAVLDVDHFKSVNDRFGHEAGDAVLREIALVLEGVVRRDDVVVRSGGEEFVVVMPGTGAVEALRSCERIAEAVRRATWDAVADGLTVTVSIGVASTEDGLGTDRLLSAADRRLYAAKRAGRDRVVAG
jgi:diguanylate cyclase (GGDEF)-like protein